MSLLLHIVEFNFCSACWTLHILFKPSSQASQVEHVAALESLPLLDLLQTDNAHVIHSSQLFLLHIRQLLQLIDQLTRLEELLDALPKPHKGVDDLPQHVQREGLVRDDVQEEPLAVTDYPYHIERKNDDVEDKGDDVEDEALLRPLLPRCDLNQTQDVLVAILKCLQIESDELWSYKEDGYLESNDNVDFIHVFTSHMEFLVKNVRNHEVSPLQSKVHD